MPCVPNIELLAKHGLPSHLRGIKSAADLLVVLAFPYANGFLEPNHLPLVYSFLFQEVRPYGLFPPRRWKDGIPPVEATVESLGKQEVGVVRGKLEIFPSVEPHGDVLDALLFQS
jgi:hypothetical protein